MKIKLGKKELKDWELHNNGFYYRCKYEDDGTVSYCIGLCCLNEEGRHIGDNYKEKCIWFPQFYNQLGFMERLYPIKTHETFSAAKEHTDDFLIRMNNLMVFV